ncbi:MAG: hypothetical protein ACD_51C00016G0003 [uncultured bacterium]|nr:MAG: hypothetical protein ACD_51C00016G0003 [uncultured bacterium]OGJ47243.1 MAG: hypothetical protein A2244_00145 [Candidatus Peregrinibacteria bacterium RIFOXYA2_FULL_41_18]OGJ53024.1 MAG: hypothetical protein A2336_03420 [Candidatus Peregrinibacteria bacterium RIFOXYB2_FULL_41_88]
MTINGVPEGVDVEIYHSGFQNPIMTAECAQGRPETTRDNAPDVLQCMREGMGLGMTASCFDLPEHLRD